MLTETQGFVDDVGVFIDEQQHPSPHLAVVLYQTKWANLVLPLSYTCQMNTETSGLSRVGLLPIEAVTTPKDIIHIRGGGGFTHTISMPDTLCILAVVSSRGNSCHNDSRKP